MRRPLHARFVDRDSGPIQTAPALCANLLTMIQKIAGNANQTKTASATTTKPVQ